MEKNFVIRHVKSFWRAWLMLVLPPPMAIGRREKLRACSGALFGIFVTGILTLLLFPEHSREIAALVAPMGASAVLLFATPASPLAQPWSVIGGNLISAFIGVTCAHWIALPLLASALALGLSLAAMLSLRCLHPPGGAVALTAVLGGPAVHAAGYGLLWFPVGVNSLLLLLLAVFFHNATRHRYPHRLHQAALAPTLQPILLVTREDLKWALAAGDEIIDIGVDDLEFLLRNAENHALSRLGLSSPPSRQRTSRKRLSTSLR